MTLRVKAPPAVAAFEARAAWLERLREKLRREHNAMGAQHRGKKLSDAEWEKYLQDVFAPRSDAVSLAIGDLRGEKKQAARALDDDDPQMTAITLPDCFEETPRRGDRSPHNLHGG